MKLADKVAVVTGAGSGIGRATSILFAREGAKVTVADNRAEPGEETARSIKNAGGESHFVLTDVGFEPQIHHMLDETLSRWGRIDILFNNAGMGFAKLLDETTEAEWDRVFSVNLKSMFYAIKYVTPHMRKQGGGVVLNMGSMNGITGQYLTPVYAATKGAIVLLTKSLAADYAGDRIRVNCLCPGIVDTEGFRAHVGKAADPEKLLSERLSRVPLGRFMSPEDIARAALYLVSADSEGVTGITHLVDGGLTAVTEYSSAWLHKPNE